MRMNRVIAVTVLGLLAGGCATTAPGPEGAAATSKEAGPEMVRITGSRIPQPADRVKEGSAATIYPLYVVDQDEMWNTGATSVGDALRHLPFLEIHR